MLPVRRYGAASCLHAGGHAGTESYNRFLRVIDDAGLSASQGEEQVDELHYGGVDFYDDHLAKATMACMLAS